MENIQDQTRTQPKMQGKKAGKFGKKKMRKFEKKADTQSTPSPSPSTSQSQVPSQVPKPSQVQVPSIPTREEKYLYVIKSSDTFEQLSKKLSTLTGTPENTFMTSMKIFWKFSQKSKDFYDNQETFIVLNDTEVSKISSLNFHKFETKPLLPGQTSSLYLKVPTNMTEVQIIEFINKTIERYSRNIINGNEYEVKIIQSRGLAFINFKETVTFDTRTILKALLNTSEIEPGHMIKASWNKLPEKKPRRDQVVLEKLIPSLAEKKSAEKKIPHVREKMVIPGMKFFDHPNKSEFVSGIPKATLTKGTGLLKVKGIMSDGDKVLESSYPENNLISDLKTLEVL